MARQKKYEVIKDLSHLKINVIAELDDDYRHEKRLVSRIHEVTTHGGSNIMYIIHESIGDVVTVSTGQQGTVQLDDGTKVPKYKHYILTQEGIDFLKGEVVVASL
jgi:hypothetical protein